MKNDRSTLRGQWLGNRLREARERAGLLLTDAAEHLQRGDPTISKYETGQLSIRRVDVLALLDLYGVSDQTARDDLVALSDEAWRKGWWEEYRDDVPDKKFFDYVWLESRAESIRCFEVTVLQGLLQTRAYTDAVVRLNPQHDESAVQRTIELRFDRQRILRRPTPPRLTVLLDESVLHRAVGSPAIMSEQFRHLGELTTRPHIELRIVPYSAQLYGAQLGAFTLFDLGDPYPEVAYVESQAGRAFVESPGVERIAAKYDALERAALPPGASAELIARAAKDFGRDPADSARRAVAEEH